MHMAAYGAWNHELSFTTPCKTARKYCIYSVYFKNASWGRNPPALVKCHLFLRRLYEALPEPGDKPQTLQKHHIRRSKANVKRQTIILNYNTLLQHWQGQISEAGEDRAAFLYEMLQFYKSLFLHAETKTSGKKDFKRARKKELVVTYRWAP